tara:strand:- start:269 stop:679 length:411 start_codon:yes stop_codon:yes gene_type:complete
MSLKSIVVSTKEVTAEFPGLEGFKVTVGAISRELLRKLREDATKTEMDSKLRMPVQKLDEQKFAEGFTRAAVKGWTGLTYNHLSKLLLIDDSAIEDMDAEVEYTEEDAILLLKESTAFDSWVNEVVYDVARFRTGK